MIEDKTKMKNIEIKTELKDKDVNIISGDKKRMTQVLLNLVNNALKFTEREGKIIIMIEKVSDRDGRLTHIKF
jgi:signal transduction histidine kinase